MTQVEAAVGDVPALGHSGIASARSLDSGAGVACELARIGRMEIIVKIIEHGSLRFISPV